MPSNAESVIEKINNLYYDLTAAEKKAADYVVSHQKETQFMSISELADLSGVAEATISRFSRRLGYKGYNALKLALANATARTGAAGAASSGQILPEDGFQDMCRKVYSSDVEAMTQTLELLKQEQIEKAVDMLLAARRVLCMGQGGSMLIATEAAHLFSVVDGKYFAVSDSHHQAIAAANLSPEDLVFFFSYSGATNDMMDTLTLVRECGASSILVTRFPKSPGAELSDLVLKCGSNESPLQLGSVPAKMAQIFLLDVIFTEMCRRDVDSALEHKSRVAKALENKHI